MNIYLIAAAVISLFTCLLHVFAASKPIVRPLLTATELHPVPKYTHYYCWHIVSLVLLSMPVGFLLAATRDGARDLGMLMTLLAGSFAVWSLFLVIWKKQKPLQMPQWALFLPTTILGGLGLWQ